MPDRPEETDEFALERVLLLLGIEPKRPPSVWLPLMPMRLEAPDPAGAE